MHGGPGRGLARIESMIEQLDLTDEQRTKVRAVLDGVRDEFRKTGDEMRATRRALRAEMDKDSLDEKVVQALAEKQGSLKAQMIVLRARTASQMKAAHTATIQMLPNTHLSRAERKRTIGAE